MKYELIDAGSNWNGKEKFQVEVCAGKSISILLNGELKNTFKIGDEAEYDSYNLRYTGKIVKITNKRVTIKLPYNDGRVRRLDFNSFCWRNKDFDAAECSKFNANEMMYI